MIPSAQLIERFALGIAAGAGVLWQSASPEQRMQFRQMAGGALLSMASEAQTVAAGHMEGVFIDLIATLNHCIPVVEAWGDEALIAEVFKARATAETLGLILFDEAPDEAV